MIIIATTTTTTAAAAANYFHKYYHHCHYYTQLFYCLNTYCLIVIFGLILTARPHCLQCRAL